MSQQLTLNVKVTLRDGTLLEVVEQIVKENNLDKDKVSFEIDDMVLIIEEDGEYVTEIDLVEYMDIKIGK